VAASTDALLATVRAWVPSAWAADSLLPGWTRAHVVAHLARNAEGLARAAEGLAAGGQVPVYDSREARDAGIAAWAALPPSALAAELSAQCARWASAFDALPDDAWDAEVTLVAEVRRTARRMVDLRRREVEIHHVDLGAGYLPSAWPQDFVVPELAEAIAVFDTRPGVDGFSVEARDLERTWPVRGGGPPTLTGPSWRLLAWLTGRDDGRYLVVTPAGPAPALPPWL
jgi:maleylpyruvate isomerase